ncbi:hypothetical protein, partial [Campylobacter rectus]
MRLELTLPRSVAVLIGCYDISLGLIGNFKSKNESYQDYLKNIDDDIFKDRARDCINKDDISKMSSGLSRLLRNGDETRLGGGGG